MSRSWLRSLGWLCLASSWSWPARADEEARRAELLQAALEARSAGRHQEAISAASRAAAIKTNSSLLRFMAEEHAELAQPVLAYREAERCLAQAAKEPSTENRDAVMTGCRFLLRDLRDRVAIVTVTVQVQPLDAPNLEIFVAGELAAGGRSVVAPGTVSVLARARGYSEARRTVELRAGADVTLPLRLLPVPGMARPASKDSAHALERRPRPAWVAPVLFGTAAAGFVVALASRLIADARYDELKRDCSDACPADLDSRRRKVEALDTVTWVSALSGVTLAGGGTAWLLLSKAPAARGSGYLVKAEVRF